MSVVTTTTTPRTARGRIVAPVLPVLAAAHNSMFQTIACANPWDGDLTGATATFPTTRHLGRSPT